MWASNSVRVCCTNLNFRDFSKYINNGERVHNRSVGCNYHIGFAARYLTQRVQTASVATRPVRIHNHVSGAVTDERLSLGTQARYYRLAGHAIRDGGTVGVEDLQNEALAQQEQLPGRRLMGGKPDIATTEFIRRRDPECFSDQFALVRV